MGLTFKKSAVVSAVALTALSVQGLTPSVAAEPTVPATPTPAAAPAPTATPATPVPTPTEAPKLLELKNGSKSTPILKLPALTLPLNLGRIDLNPQTAPASSAPRFGGGAYGIRTDINLGFSLQLKSSKLGAIGMDPNGATTERTAAVVQLPTVPVPLPVPDFNVLAGAARGITVKTWGYESYPAKLPTAVAHSDVVNFGAQVLFSTHVANGIKAIAIVKRLANGEYEFTGRSLFDSVSFVGLINHDSQEVAPNTTVAVPGLGKVILNEQKITRLPGERQGIEVNAIHIILGTSLPGVPIGSDIYVGSAEAILYE